IVAGGRVFVTSQIGTGISRPGPRLAQGSAAAAAGERALGTARSAPSEAASGRTYFLVEAFDRRTGSRLWSYRFEAAGPVPAMHAKHNLASPRPGPDGALLCAWIGPGQS